MDEGRVPGVDDPGAAPRFVLIRLDDGGWVIQDRRPPHDGVRVAARIAITEEDEVHVVWLSPTPLPVRYARPEDVLVSLEMWQLRPHGSTKPIPIPHFPPPSCHAR